MAEFSWAYIDSEAVVKVDGPTGSVQYRVADSDGHTVMSGSSSLMWHTASSALEILGELTASAISASTFVGNGVGLTGVITAADPAGANTEIQFNDNGTMSASSDLTWDGSQITVNGNVTASAVSASTFVGDGSNLTGIGAHTLPAGIVNEIQFNNGAGSFAASSDLTWDGASLVVTGALELTGSATSLITLHTRDDDSLKEIAFLKDGVAAAAIQINDAEHLFIENENPKDIILRANNQNALRVVGSERRVIVGNVS